MSAERATGRRLLVLVDRLLGLERRGTGGDVKKPKAYRLEDNDGVHDLTVYDVDARQAGEMAKEALENGLPGIRGSAFSATREELTRPLNYGHDRKSNSKTERGKKGKRGQEIED